jgi:hypothetical protein
MNELVMALEALKIAEVIVPELVRAIFAVATLFHPSGAANTPSAKAEALAVFNEVLAAARDAVGNVANLNFGHDDPIAEGLAKFQEAVEALRTRREAEGKPIGTSEARTAVQLAYDARKVET